MPAVGPPVALRIGMPPPHPMEWPETSTAAPERYHAAGSDEMAAWGQTIARLQVEHIEPALLRLQAAFHGQVYHTLSRPTSDATTSA